MRRGLFAAAVVVLEALAPSRLAGAAERPTQEIAEARPDSEVENGLDESFQRGGVHAVVDGATSRPRGGASGKGLREAELDTRLSIPIHTELSMSRAGPSGWFWLANLSARGYLPSDALTGRTDRFYRFGAGTSLAFLTSSLNFYSLAVGARIAESERTLGEPRFQPVATGLATYRFNAHVTLLYGAAFTYMLGTGRALPLLGLNWKISWRWRFSTLLPAFLFFEYAINEDLRLSFGAALSGDTFGWERLVAPGVTDHPRLRVARLRALARLSYGREDEAQLRFMAGLEGQNVDRSGSAGDDSKYTGLYAGLGVDIPYEL